MLARWNHLDVLVATSHKEKKENVVHNVASNDPLYGMGLQSSGPERLTPLCGVGLQSGGAGRLTPLCRTGLQSGDAGRLTPLCGVGLQSGGAGRESEPHRGHFAGHLKRLREPPSVERGR